MNITFVTPCSALVVHNGVLLVTSGNNGSSRMFKDVYSTLPTLEQIVIDSRPHVRYENTSAVSHTPCHDVHLSSTHNTTVRMYSIHHTTIL
jgi:hypothetical protein